MGGWAVWAGVGAEEAESWSLLGSLPVAIETEGLSTTV